MCYNLSYIERDAQTLHDRYNHLLPDPEIEHQLELPLYYFVSGFDHPELPIITSKGIELFQWGLIPFWIKDANAAKTIQPQTLNAVGETAFEKPAYKDCIVKQRCLVPVNGFFEWQDFKKVKYPHYIQTKSKELFSIGGIHSTWTDKSTGEMLNTFAILTTPANPMMEKIHNIKKRMPLIIAPQNEQHWIDPNLSKDKIQQLIQPYDESDMTSYTISRHINSAKNDRNMPEVLNAVNYAELNEMTLF